jgi:ferric-chelate reductase
MNNAMTGMMAQMSQPTLTPLYATGYDLTNETQAMAFLSMMLDDSIIQIWGNEYARYFWYGIVTVIGFFAIHNLLWRVNLKLRYRVPSSSANFCSNSISTLMNRRLRAAAARRARPAAATTTFAKLFAVFTAVLRKLSYPQLTPVRGAFWFKVPPFSTVMLVLGYIGFIMGLEHINNNVPGAQHYAALGIRAGWLAIAQVPLLILLAGKNNLIGLVAGISYERLNVLHRWVARGALLLATLHVGYQNYGWNQYGLRHLEWTTDTCPPTGVGAYVLLCWLNLSTLAPFRNFCYEFFVFQHLITFFGFVIAIMLHLPSTALYTRVYMWIPIGLYLFDRLVRTLRSMWNNIHPGRATLEVVAGGVTKIRVQARVKRWSPGAHVLLSIPRYGIGQSHPATIASTATSHNGDLLFILKGQKGFTRALLKSANSSTTSLLAGTKEERATQQKAHITFIDGPYGASQADFACFDSVLLIAGSTGVTFTLPILLDLAHRASKQRQQLPVCRIEFVWVIRNAEQTSWISEELQSAYTQLQQAGIDIKISIFITRDDHLIDLSSAFHRGHDTNTAGPQAVEPTVHAHGSTEDDISGSEGTATPSLENSVTLQTVINEKTSLLECASIEIGRPAFQPMMSGLMARAEGETGVAVCGPLGLSTSVRMTVASLNGRKCKGWHGIYLHVEGFCW